MTKVALQAEDAMLIGNLKFRRSQGWAHDSVLNWRTETDSMTWELDVLSPGSYDITLMYGCTAQDVGTTVQIEINGQQAHVRQTR